MTRLVTMLAACSLLAACGDPLRNVDRLSSVELADDAVTVGALPDPATASAPKGLFSNLFSGRQNAPAATPIETTVTPLESIDTDSAVGAALGAAATPEAIAATETVAAPAVAVPAAAPAPQKRGLFGWGRPKNAAASAPIVTATTTKRIAPAEIAPVDVPPAVAETIPAPEATPTAPVVAEAKPRTGFFGRLAGARKQDKAEPEEVTVRTASLGPVTAPQSTRQTQTAFKSRNRKHKGPDVQIVPFGTTLPAGAIARVCDLPSGRLGKEVGKFPERGRGYKMFDSNPSAAGTRPFYVTGFDDKCARTFTAALALFGSPTLHEQLRYGLPSSKQPYSTTDQAYEGIKRSVCGVSKQKPCGAKISQLEKDTAFISIYDRIGSNSKWSNILLHKGWVLASDRKG
ncbi:hypothetical protein [Planktotalea sp.]|uniref:hypothetical protein n=1 Tax=Planktotalea sp. TaxID=2029877 RepID=UPI003296A63E